MSHITTCCNQWLTNSEADNHNEEVCAAMAQAIKDGELKCKIDTAFDHYFPSS